METENNLNDLRVASFSCYLKPIEGVANMFDAGEHFTDMAGSESNNQGALLHRRSSNSKRWFHSCTSPCATKKAVYVQQSIKKEDQFTFPVMINPVQELPRMSIEVFGSGTMNKGEITKNLARKMSILTWDAIPTRNQSVISDDMGSEASSDLFEIDNMSRTVSESSCLSPLTRYAPSEGSIQWSVVTTTAAGFSSVYSGYGKKQTVYNTRVRTKIEPPKNSQKKLDNGLLGCNSFKSVKVVEPVYRTSDKSNQ